MQILPSEFANLTPKQIRCLPLLSAGLSASEVAKKAKVSQVQISEWKRDTQFMAALDSIRRNAMREAETALNSLAMEAIQTLRELLNNATSEHTKLRAAMYIIDKISFAENLGSKEAELTETVNMNLLLTALGLKPGES